MKAKKRTKKNASEFKYDRDALMRAFHSGYCAAIFEVTNRINAKYSTVEACGRWLERLKENTK